MTCAAERTAPPQAAAIPALEPRLAALRRTAPTRLGPEVLAIFEFHIQQTLRSGLGRGAPAVGTQPPPLPAGAPVPAGPLVVTWFRGGWCLYCREALAALRDAVAPITEAGAQVVAVSPQTPAANAATAADLALPFPLLSDPGAAAAQAWGLAVDLDDTMRRLFLELGRDLPAVNDPADPWRLPLPATFVLAAYGRVAWRFVHGDYSRRAEPADVVAAVRSLRHSA